MKALIGIIAAVAIAGGGVASYDFATGDVGILPTCCTLVPKTCHSQQQSAAVCEECCSECEAPQLTTSETCPDCTAGSCCETAPVAAAPCCSEAPTTAKVLSADSGVEALPAPQEVSATENK